MKVIRKATLLLGLTLPVPGLSCFFCWLWGCEKDDDDDEPPFEHVKLHWAPKEDAIDDQYMVVFDDTFPAEQVHSKAMSLLVDAKQTTMPEILEEYEILLKGFAVLHLSDATLQSILDDEDVEFVSQDRRVEDLGQQADPPNWGLDRIDQTNLPLDQNYCYKYTGKGVKVFVIEGTGIRSSHDEFGGRVTCGWYGHGSTDCEPDLTLRHEHGTLVASVVGGQKYGVAKEVDIITVRQTGSAITSYTAALEYISRQKTLNETTPMVVNMSFRTSGTKEEMKNFTKYIDKLVDQGVVAVAAAGNDGEDACNNIPASSDKVITVGWTDASDTRNEVPTCVKYRVLFGLKLWCRERIYKQSAYGTCVDLFAPGDKIRAAYFKSDSASLVTGGTSVAAPHVTGAAAMYLQQNPTWTPQQVKDQLLLDAGKGFVQDAGKGSPNLLLQIEALGCETNWNYLDQVASYIYSPKVVYFLDGSYLPMNKYYQLRYENGCMKLSSGHGWIVTSCHLSDGVSNLFRLPGTGVQYGSYEECVEANRENTEPVHFFHTGGPLGVRFTDIKYGDNINGLVNPTFSLHEYVGLFPDPPS